MRTFLLTIPLIWVVTFTVFATPSDSLAVENHNGKSFVVHKVTEGETLYSLLKRYNCRTEDVLRANPTLKNSVIQLHQILRFPVSKTETAENVILLGKNWQFKEVQPTKTQLHQVAEGETLYSISKKYGIEIAKLKELNALEENTLVLGQKLIVAENYQPIGAAGDEVIVKKKPVKRPTNASPTDYVPNAPRGKRMSEAGIAAAINAGRSSNKLLALHRTAPIGSYIKVTNEGNGKSIIVKVLGRLPETGINQDVVIRLSPTAFEKLQPRDTRIRVALAYELVPN